MAGRGRGRGRGAPGQEGDAPPIVGGGGEVDLFGPFQAAVKSLSVEIDEQEMLVTAGIAKKLGTSKENLDRIVQVIYERCYTEWRFAKCAAALCHDLDGLQADDIKFRSVVLRYIQMDYKRKDELKQESVTKFLGCAAFLCQMFGVVRVGNNDPMVPLVNPVLDVLGMCLEKQSSEEETLCGAVQLFVVGKLLQDVGDRMRVNTLKNLIRDKVLDNVASRTTRLLLIDAVEGFASNWRMHGSRKT